MQHTYNLIRSRPRRLLAALSLLMIVEIGLAFANLLPVEHEGLLRWPLMLTIVALVGTAWFTGVVAPVAPGTIKRAIKVLRLALLLFLAMVLLSVCPPLEGTVRNNSQAVGWLFAVVILTWVGLTVLVGAISPVRHQGGIAYLIFGIAPQAFLIWISLCLGILWFVDRLERFDPELLSLLSWAGMIFGGPFMILAMVLLITLTGTGALSARAIAAKVLKSLGIGAAVVAAIAMAVLFAATFSDDPWAAPWAIVILMPFLVILTLTVLMTVWYGRLPPHGQKVVGSLIGLSATFIIAGWIWYAAMDDGLSALAGEERAAAESALRVHCAAGAIPMAPASGQVVSAPGGGFQVSGYTWWGLPARCS